MNAEQKNKHIEFEKMYILKDIVKFSEILNYDIHQGYDCYIVATEK